MRTDRSYRALLGAAVLGPAVLFAAMAWWSWQRVNRETAASIERTVDILYEHTVRLFQFDGLLLDRIEDRVAGLDWPEVARHERELHLFLRGISDDVEEVEAAFVADADGELQALSRSFPVPARLGPAPTGANVRDRAYFQEARRHPGIVIDGPFRGRVSGKTIFNIARRLKNPDGSFRGVAVLVVSPRSLGEFWKTVIAAGDSVSLVRDDGVVLARYPEAPIGPDEAPPHFSAYAMERFRAGERRQFTANQPSLIDGIVRTIGYRKLSDQPIYIAYAVDRRNVLREWAPTAAAFGGLAAASMVGLFLAALAVVRRARGEEAATVRAEGAAAALRASEAHQRALYDKTPAPMYACDLDGKILAVSDRWLDLLGYEREEAIGRTLGEFQPPSVAATMADSIFRPLLEHGEVRDVERQYRRKSGEILDVLVSARIERGPDGRARRCLGVLVDITERKRIAAALQQVQKMEAIGQMTGGVAHDFNNLLTIVAGNLEMIGTEADHPDRVRAMAARALAAAQRGGALTQQLLAFARRQMLRPRTVNPNRLIKDFLPLIRQAAGEAVNVQAVLSPTLDPCRLDPTLFEAAMLNLVVNARDAMPSSTGGTIAIETRNIEVAAGEASRDPEFRPGAYVLVAVTDTGHGMPPDVLEKVFEPFFTTKEVGQGSGLGLSMVYGFVKQSGGHVAIRSEVGVGTTVMLYLPRSSGAASNEAADAGTAPPAPSRHPPAGGCPATPASVLLVDDNDEVRAVTRDLLRFLGYDVVSARNAAEALAVLRAETRRIDVLFTDVVMPGGMAGDELARQALTLRPGIKILLASGYATRMADGDRDRGGFPILQKPYKRAELAACLRALLAGVEPPG